MDVIKDKAGNELHEGDAVWFDPLGGIATIIKVDFPGRIDTEKPGVVSLRVDIPFVAEKGKSVAGGFAFGFFLVTRDPRSGSQEREKVEDANDRVTKKSKIATM